MRLWTLNSYFGAESFVRIWQVSAVEHVRFRKVSAVKNVRCRQVLLYSFVIYLSTQLYLHHLKGEYKIAYKDRKKIVYFFRKFCCKICISYWVIYISYYSCIGAVWKCSKILCTLYLKVLILEQSKLGEYLYHRSKKVTSLILGLEDWWELVIRQMSHAKDEISLLDQIWKVEI